MSDYKQHRDKDGNKSGTSEDKTDWLGNEYTQHRDRDYNKSGTSEEKTDWLGNDYTQHRDNDYSKSGTSEEKTDWLGNKYTQHYDSDGNKSGTSETKTDWLGNEYTQHHDSDGNKSGTSEDKEGCFLSTACVRAQGLPDDCAELDVLRRFRDDHLSKTTQGQRLVAEYYQVAPAIVRSINFSGNAKAIYAEMYSMLVLPCVSFIRHGRYTEARELYAKFVSDLVARFILKR